MARSRASSLNCGHSGRLPHGRPSGSLAITTAIRCACASTQKLNRAGRERGLLACWLHGAGFGGVLGGDSRYRTSCPPRSHRTSLRREVRNGNFHSGDGRRKAALLQAETKFGDSTTSPKALFPARQMRGQRTKFDTDDWVVAEAVERNRSPTQEQGIF